MMLPTTKQTQPHPCITLAKIPRSATFYRLPDRPQPPAPPRPPAASQQPPMKKGPPPAGTAPPSFRPVTPQPAASPHVHVVEYMPHEQVEEDGNEPVSLFPDCRYNRRTPLRSDAFTGHPCAAARQDCAPGPQPQLQTDHQIRRVFPVRKPPSHTSRPATGSGDSPRYS